MTCTYPEAGGGDGAFDLFVSTTDAGGAQRAIERAARELGSAKDLLVEALPEVSLADLWDTRELLGAP